jgi:hypothetical protein
MIIAISNKKKTQGQKKPQHGITGKGKIDGGGEDLETFESFVFLRKFGKTEIFLPVHCSDRIIYSN